MVETDRLDQKFSRLSGFTAIRYTPERILASSVMALDDAREPMIDQRGLSDPGPGYEVTTFGV
jgi:hypothetical protein